MTNISHSEFEQVKAIVRGWGDGYQVQNLVYEVESLQIIQEYYYQLSTGRKACDIRRELSERYEREDGAIQYVIYQKS